MEAGVAASVTRAAVTTAGKFGRLMMQLGVTAARPGGAYGLRIIGLPGASRLLQPGEAGWPTFDVQVQVGEPERVVPRWGSHDACINLQGGGVSLLNRDPLSAVLTMPFVPRDEEILHPFLAGSAAVANRWLDRDSFHGGAFVLRGGAWVILGAKESGKSSTLGWLSAHGTPILTDDLVIVDGDDQVLIGPRCVDLREEAAASLGFGDPLGLVGARHRWRHVVPPAPDAVPLRGWILPSWGKDTEITEVTGFARLGLIAEHFTLHGPGQAERTLDFAAKPCLRFNRPKSWSSLAPSMTQLLHRLATYPPS